MTCNAFYVRCSSDFPYHPYHPTWVGAAGRTAPDGWDAAAREWLLPRIAALSESKKAADALRAMIKRMLAPDPSKRPTFPELLEELTLVTYTEWDGFGAGVSPFTTLTWGEHSHSTARPRQ